MINTKRKAGKEKLKMLQQGFTLFVMLSVMIVVLVTVSVQVKSALRIQMQETLADVTQQNVVAVKKEMRSEFRLLQGVSNDLENKLDSPKKAVSWMDGFVDIYHLKRMGIIYADGTCYTTDGYVQNMAFREFFKVSMTGKKYVSDIMEDRIGNKHELINVLSVPVYGAGHRKVVAVLFATYRARNFQNILSIKCFGGKGYGCLIKENGTIIVNSSESRMVNVTNIFSALSVVQGNRCAAGTMKSDIGNRESGYIEFYIDGRQCAFYTPLQLNNEDVSWYMLTIVPEYVLNQRLSKVTDVMNILFTLILFSVGIGLMTYRYISKKRRAELMKIAYEDKLTRGWNYARFKKEMVQNGNVKGYLVAMDINEFKIINNVCGTDTGDTTIRQIWHVLENNRKEGELCARVDGDRFVLFMLADDRDKLVRRIHKISGEILQIADQINIPEPIPAFGIYYMTDFQRMEEYYSYANQAKHLIKGNRKRNYAFYEDVDVNSVLEKNKMESRFETAIAQHEFEVWYQPKYGVESFAPVSAEALIRWRKPDGEMISPGKFIPVFEKNGMISTLDEYVFREVCRQQKEWMDEGKKILPVSVNISRASLYFNGIVEKYKEILGEHNLATDYIELEITESAMIGNTEISKLIEAFRAEGFRLLLDDFGEGYSSLSTLNAMHFDTLKLDKSLIDYIGDENGEKLLRAVTGLAQSLGLTITAEGVETIDQVHFIQKLRCDDIQGFYFSKPLPVDDYQALL